MALLIPLLVPPLAELTAGLGALLEITDFAFLTQASHYAAIGVANAVQGEKSNFSFTIGGKVFSTHKPFPFNALP